jgi:hypothetical protein
MPWLGGEEATPPMALATPTNPYLHLREEGLRLCASSSEGGGGEEPSRMLCYSNVKLTLS